MKKLFAVLALSLALAGCANLKSAYDTITTITEPRDNPVTKEMLYNVEAGAVVLVAGLNAYKRSCEQRVIPQSCRVTVAKVQAYTRRVPPLLTTLRAFVKNNDQINAPVVYRTVIQLLKDARTEAVAGGISVGG